MSLSGRNAVITGGGSGIGLATCQRLSRDGASVAVFDLNLEAAERVAEQLRTDGGAATAVAVDVSKRTEVDRAVSAAREKFGPIHVLVNCAGVIGTEPFQSISEETWDRFHGVNLKGSFLCAQAVIGDMVDAGWGRIVNISSSAALSGAANLAHYVASKAGVIGLTKALALEFGHAGVTVNCVPPASIDTPLRAKTLQGHSKRVREGRLDIPVGHIGTPEDVAAACAFLVSEEAGYITGQVLAVNGGRYM